jgi:Holliday junction DNA helicase RuvA
MISYLVGNIIAKGRGFIIIKVNNIGYKIFVSSSFFAELNSGQEADLYTYQYVREDALDLYGFRSLSELEMFELLLSISGIGPKSALGVMSIATVTDLKKAIAQGDSSLLIKVSGIGKKTAERVVLELREKVSASEFEREMTDTGNTASGEEIDALVALGYSISQAREALRQVKPEIIDSGERIKAALKLIGR